MAKLKFGLIVDQGELSFLLVDLLAMAQRSEHYSIDCLVVQSLPENKVESFLTKLATMRRPAEFLDRLKSKLFLSIVALERYMLMRQAVTREFHVTKALDDIDLPQVLVTPEVSASGHVFRYSKNDLATLEKRGLDGLIRGGSGILRGEILSLCRFGVLSFHHGDNDRFRGGPAAFWEVYRKEKSTGFIVQKLNDEIDGGDVYVKGSIGTEPTFLQNQVKLFRKSGVFLHLLLEKIAASGDFPEPKEAVPYSNPLFRFTPKLTVQLHYLYRYLWRYFIMQVDAVLGRGARWGVSYQFVDKWQQAVLWRSTEIKNPPNHFLADPFVYHRDDKHYLFVEDYDYAVHKGVITVYEVGEDGAHELGLALEEDFHLSYPFLLEHEGELFMIPETEQKREIRMYRSVEFPLKWELHRVLMSNIATADTTIFPYQGRWWMFTNVDTACVEDHDSELHIFHADAPDSTHWVPHNANPVIFDSLFARMGGLLEDDDGSLFRVYQKQGFDVYGEAMGIAKIEKLDENDYVESRLVEMEPTFYQDINGTHTYSFSRGLLAIDHRRWERLTT